MQFSAFRNIGIDVGKLEGIRSLDQQLLVLEHGTEPVSSRHYFIYPDFAVAVGIYQLKGFGREFEALRRTAQDCPELLVEFAQVGDIFSVAYVYTHYAAE